MDYPVAPADFIVAFGNKRSFESKLISQRFKGGVEERSTGLSINPVSDTWNLQLEIHRLFRYRRIEAFIVERDGEPFRFDWDGDGVVTDELYRIESHQWNWSGYYHWQLTVQLKRVFRPT